MATINAILIQARLITKDIGEFTTILTFEYVSSSNGPVSATVSNESSSLFICGEIYTLEVNPSL